MNTVLVIVGIIIIAMVIILFKFNQIKDNKEARKEFNKIALWLSLGVFVVLVVVFIAVGAGDTNEYLNAGIKSCPSTSLKEGLENLKSFYNKYNVYFSYKVKKGESVGGEEVMYLYLYNMESVYNYNVYIPLELNGKTVSLKYVYKIGGGVEGRADSVELILCGNYK